jgi:5-methylcytosine-specific restriction enzyme B
MVLELIKQEIENYKKLIISSKYDELYKWEAMKNFHDNWNIESHDFQNMFDKSFHSDYTDNLWANPHWFPKAVMLDFIKYDKERIREMFRGLYNEGENVDKRIERFVFHCDKVREEIYSFDKRMKNHFHDGQRMVSLYLAFRFPEKYAIYKYTEFKTFMEKVRAKDIPKTGEHERFFKVVRTLYSILIKDDELMKIHKAILRDDCYKGETLMLSQDFIFKIARRYMKMA